MGFMDSPDGMAERAQRREGAPRARSVAFVTLGCAKNEVDTAHMRERVEAAGHAVVDDPALADAVVVNTCSFIQRPPRRASRPSSTWRGFPAWRTAAPPWWWRAACRRATARRWKTSFPRRAPSCRVPARTTSCRCWKACSPQLPESAPGTPGAVGGGRAGAGDGNAPTAAGDGAAEGGAGVQPDGGFPAEADAAGARGAVSAYVKISDGCDRFCSYCTIPLIRGRYRSFPLADVCAEVDAHVARGVREIVLVAQDTGRWGTDFDAPSSLAALLSALAERHPRTWFRVMYVQPEGVDDALLDAVAAHANVCPYFDVPLQHVDPELLSAMNRRGSRAEFEDLARRIRERVPGAVLRTTLIAGFPGETEEQFQSLCDFVEDAPSTTWACSPTRARRARAPSAFPVSWTRTRRPSARSVCATWPTPRACRASPRAWAGKWTC